MSRFRANPGAGRSGGIIGKLFGSLFFLAFGSIGLAFTVWLGMQVYRDAQTYTWPSIPCTILESSVIDKGGNSPYQLQVRYQYDWQGQTHTSGQFATQPRRFSDYSEPQRLVHRFDADTKAFCYVNPANPNEAILQRNSLWIALFIFIPLVFVFIGFGALYFTWRKAPASPPPPLSVTPKIVDAVQGKKVKVVFWLAFLVIGSIAFVFIFLLPLIRTIQARDWNHVPCTVISSRVQSHTSDDGTTYSVDILYSYEVDGREYKANRYTFLGGSSSGRRGKQKVVNQHPPGAKTICYVNPRDPTDAVLHRGLSPVMFFGLIPLVFVVIGAAGVTRTLRQPKTGVQKDAVPRGPAPLKVGGGLRGQIPARPIELKPKTSPRAKFIGFLCISVFWNGIVSIFVVVDIRMWMGRDTGSKWLLTIFLIPFVLVGLLLIYGTIHSFFGLFSPRARLRASHAPVALGESVEITWQFEGRVDKLRELKLLLEGRDERDEGSGKNRRTDANVFYKADIAHFTNVNDLKTGSVLCTIPPDHPPSDPEGTASSGSSASRLRLKWVPTWLTNTLSRLSRPSPPLPLIRSSDFSGHR